MWDLGPGRRRVPGRHGRARHARGPASRPDRRARHRRQHARDVFDRQRAALQHLARRGTTPFRSEKNSNWEGAYRVPTFVRFPGRFPEGVTLNGIVSHEDWLPTFAAIAGNPDIKEQLREGVEINGRDYRNYIDGYDLTAYLSGETDDEPAEGVLVRQRRRPGRRRPLRRLEGHLPREPGRGLRRLARALRRAARAALFNLRRDPFEKAQHNSNTYNDWFLDRPFVIVPIQALCRAVPADDAGLPAEPVAGLLQSLEDRGAASLGGRRRNPVTRDEGARPPQRGRPRTLPTAHSRRGMAGLPAARCGPHDEGAIHALTHVPPCSARSPSPRAALADPLPSWNDTDAKAAIVAFVDSVTDPASTTTSRPPTGSPSSTTTARSGPSSRSTSSSSSRSTGCRDGRGRSVDPDLRHAEGRGRGRPRGGARRAARRRFSRSSPSRIPACRSTLPGPRSPPGSTTARHPETGSPTTR
jgi:hypothetical protein